VPVLFAASPSTALPQAVRCSGVSCGGGSTPGSRWAGPVRAELPQADVCLVGQQRADRPAALLAPGR
jgi:hypothetical protein